MKFTTNFELRSQATRLQETTNYRRHRQNRTCTFYGTPVKGNLYRRRLQTVASIRYTALGRDDQKL